MRHFSALHTKVALIISGNHQETIQLLLILFPRVFTYGRPGGSLVGGLHIILTVSVQLFPPHQPARSHFPMSQISTVPAGYLGEVFSRQHALSLLLHRPYDCCIYLGLHCCPVTFTIFPDLSRRQWRSKSRIQPLSSPMGVGFFFVQKKDGSLCPRINYRALNDITFKDKHALPLLSSAFGPFHRAQVFSKLALWNAYHLVQISQGAEWKNAFNTPLGHFEYLVMPFGLTNCILLYSSHW